MGKMEFLGVPNALLRLLNYSPSGLWLFRAESPREKNCGPPGWSGNQEDLSPPSLCPRLRRDSEPGSGEILNRAPGNNSTLDDFLLRSLGSILKSDHAVHNPPTQHRWTGTDPDPPLKCLRKPPASPANALTTSAAPKGDTPAVETALNRLSEDCSTGFV